MLCLTSQTTLTAQSLGWRKWPLQTVFNHSSYTFVLYLTITNLCVNVSRPGSIVASVNSYFQPYSPATQESVASAMDTAIKNATNCGTADCGILAGAQYTGVYLEKIQHLGFAVWTEWNNSVLISVINYIILNHFFFFFLKTFFTSTLILNTLIHV